MGVIARCPVCNLTVEQPGGFSLSISKADHHFAKKRGSVCPRCYANPCRWQFEPGDKGDCITGIFDDHEPMGYVTCSICGRRADDLVQVMTVTGDLLRVCRHGHFQGVNIHPFAGIRIHMTGPKMLDSLLYFPEGFVPSMKRDLWAEVTS